MKKITKAGLTCLCVLTGAGLVIIMVACFSGGIAWIPEAFSFLSQFGF